jgi:16S rRNA (guanine966-N2)-methyltransferase
MSRVRIIAGHYGGRTIRVLAGETTRPTAERTREAWASTITSLLPEGFAQRRVLDAFAGSGALGFEALSRGATHVTFCERDRRAGEILRENRELFDEEHHATTILSVDIFTSKAVRLLKEAGPYDLVVLDPPYVCATGKIKTLLHSLAVVGALNTEALITYEQGNNAKEGLDGSVLCAACSPASLQMVSCKTYGTSRIEYLRYR